MASIPPPFLGKKEDSSRPIVIASALNVRSDIDIGQLWTTLISACYDSSLSKIGIGRGLAKAAGE